MIMIIVDCFLCLLCEQHCKAFEQLCQCSVLELEALLTMKMSLITCRSLSECLFSLVSNPLLPGLPSTRQHLSYDDCLDGRREDYQICSVLYCVQ